MVTYRAAKEEELEACIELQCMAFRSGQGDAPARYRSYVREDPTYRLGQTRIAVIGNRIVGHLRVWDRKLAIRGQTITAGGVGSLLTHPDYRGQGIASGLLQDSERYFQEVGYDIGLLFSIIGTSYYASRGWTPIPISTFELDVGEVSRRRQPIARGLRQEEDLAEVIRLHAKCSSNYTCPEVRDEAYWMTGPARYRSVFPKVGIKREGRVRGYVNWDIVNGSVWVVECCGEGEDVYSDLAGIVVQAARASEASSILGSLPIGHLLVCELEAATGNTALWSTHDEMMVKISRWDQLQNKLGGAIPHLPEQLPKGQANMDAFLKTLLGCSDSDILWGKMLGPCPPMFYWWTDIF